ncbi:MAG: HYR domain-containing protein [Verrucomicrobia bacterium]|nr:MAG: HYR domain-containing protein [Verrucomicrobiota bacterium]
MFIDGNLVVDAGGVHPPGAASGSASLTAGVHSFEVQFFECCGDPAGVDLSLPAGVTFGGIIPPTVVCDPPSGSTFPVGTNVVTCCATDAAGNSNCCSFNIVVEDREAPVAACREGVNPSGKKIPVAGKNPASGQNPDGYYQLLSKDNCDSDPAIYLADNGSSFVAGPFHSGDVIKLTQSPGKTPSQDPAPAPIVAHLHFKGDGLLFAIDASGNKSEVSLCLVPRPPK